MPTQSPDPQEAPHTYLRIEYTNWRGETTIRTIQPMSIWFGNTKWHSLDQWFLHALDVDKGEERDFALTDISKWIK